MLVTINSVAISRSVSENPFGLVYKNAITENTKGKVNIHPVTYKLNGIDIAANVYSPANYDASKKYPAITIAHPNTIYPLQHTDTPHHCNTLYHWHIAPAYPRLANQDSTKTAHHHPPPGAPKILSPCSYLSRLYTSCLLHH